MVRLFFYSFLILFLALGSHVFAQVNEQSQIDQIPDKSDFIKKLVTSAMNKGEKEVTLSPGIYRLSEAVELKQIKNIVLNAKGVTLLMTKPGEVLRVDKCDHFTIRGLSIDFDPLPFTQGTITAISNDAQTVEFEIHKGYPKLTNAEGKLTFNRFNRLPRHYFDAKTRLWKKDVNQFAQPELDVVEGVKGKAIFSKPQNGVEVGDFIAFDRRKVNGFAAVQVRESTGPVTFEDINIYAACGLTFCGRWCDAPTIFRRVKIGRGPTPSGATQERLLSTNADGINYAYCSQGPVLEDCDFSFMGDDALNVHGRFIEVLKVKSPTEILLIHPSLPEGIVKLLKKNSTARFLEGGTFSRVGDAIVSSISVIDFDNTIPRDEVLKCMEGYKDLVKVASMDISKCTYYSLKFTKPVDFIKAGQWVDFPSINTPNYIVKNSYFHDHRARGLRIMADNGIIEGNRFERLGSAAIQVGPEYAFWREAGWLDNVIIRKNQFKEIGYGGELKGPSCYVPGAIVVASRTDKGTPPYPSENRNIIIEDNSIEDCPLAAVYAYGVQNLVVKNNKAKHVMYELPSKVSNQFGLNPKKAFDYEWAIQVNDSGNTVE